MKYGLSLLLVCALLLPILPITQAQDSASRFESAPCPFEVPADVNAECGYLITPEDHSQPDGPTIRLAVVILHTDSAAPKPDPVVYLQGGPGGIIVQYALDLRAVQFPDRDMIIFDQRGIGFSEPSLDCTELNDPALITNPSADDNPMQDCRDRLVGAGVNIAAYNSAQNAADVAALRVALGYEEWNVIGASYGTYLALTVMRDHPAGIRSVILDSVFPPHINGPMELRTSYERAFRTFFDGCTADPDCAAKYPDLENRFYALLTRLNANPIVLPVLYPPTGELVDVPITGDGLINGLWFALWYTELIPYLPMLIDQVDHDDPTLLAYLAPAFVWSLTDGISEGMNYTVSCSEDVAFVDRDAFNASLEGMRPELRAYVEGQMQMYLAGCDLWDVPPADAGMSEAVTSAIPTLIFTGQYDSVTPTPWGASAAELLPNSFYYDFPGIGHGVYLANPCAQQIARDFMDDPTVEPDSSCIAEMTGPDFE